MAYLIAVVAIVLVFLVVLVVLKRVGTSPRGGVASQALPYRKRDWLLSKAEQSFYRVLQQTVAAHWLVFAKVRLLDLVWLPHDTPNAQTHLNRVQSKHVDFVLCSRDAVAPVLVIELDDASHERADRRSRDSFVDQVLAVAGLPILRVPAKRAYSTAELGQQISALVSDPPVVAPPIRRVTP